MAKYKGYAKLLIAFLLGMFVQEQTGGWDWVVDAASQVFNAATGMIG